MKGNSFQLIILAIFGALVVIGVLFFALFPKAPSVEETLGEVVFWGTLDEEVMRKQIEFVANNQSKNAREIKYFKKDLNTYDDELVEALASGVGPDVFMVSQDDIIDKKNKITPIPYENISERFFKDTYIEEGELFLDVDGIVAVPYTIDPLVMYWNRNILSREGISTPPEYWDEFFVLSPKITKRDQSSNILSSTVALGEYSNIKNAKEILSALILQSGDKIITRQPDGSLKSVFGFSGDKDDANAESALRFYTEFSNPVKSVYSWNRALPNSRQSFLAGDLAFYFGFASEFKELRNSNPNLNFDVSNLPQVRDDKTPVTYGKMQGLAISKASQNKGGALLAIKFFTSSQSLTDLADLTGLPPVSRQLLKSIPQDSYSPVFYKSAIISNAWLDPDREETDDIFKNMVESITSGRFNIYDSLRNAGNEINSLLKKTTSLI